MSDEPRILSKGLAVIILVVLIYLFIPWACQSPDSAKRVLEENGYTHIEITGYRWFACDEKDTFSTGFRATNAAGKPISGVVCSGLFKKSTIRFD